MFAAIDTQILVLLVFVAISALASWLKKKQGGEEGDEEKAPRSRRPHSPGMPPPAPSEVQPPPKSVSWEEELRQLLAGETPQSPPPPPPIIVHQGRPAPPPLPEPASPPKHVHRSVFDVVEEADPVDVDVEPKFQALPGLHESVQAFQQASQLDRKVEAHMRDVTHRPVGLTSAHRAGATAEATTALALVRNPKSLRAALLASVILGPPRALAEQGGGGPSSL